jgi:hypothetical protein
MMRKFVPMLAAGLLMLVTYPAKAADFTFDVPVELSSVSAEVTQVSLSCRAVRFSNLSNLRADPRTPIAFGLARAVPLTAARSYSGIIRVEANTERPHLPTEANGYMCSISFYIVGRDTSVDIIEWFPPAAGPPPVLQVMGLFPATR